MTIKIDENISKYKIFTCPDCKEDLRIVASKEEVICFSCKKCNLVFPVIDDIPIILPSKSRNYSLEYPLLSELRKKSKGNENLLNQIIHTLELIESQKDNKSWEWEDEEYWTKEYKKNSIPENEKNWNLRIWQREFLVDNLIKQFTLKGKTILDVGCGEGQNFRFLLSKYCDGNSFYIATDISLEGLKLNRSRNNHNNSIYVLCSADYLPFKKETIDILCYFGILHHTEMKYKSIKDGSLLVKKVGFILLHEGLDHHKSFSLYLPRFMRPKIEDSAHEERINREKMIAHITDCQNLKILKRKETNTLFLMAALRFFGNSVTSYKLLYRVVSFFDVLFRVIFQWIFPFFKGAEIMMLIKKEE